jgi:hypothetical protein
MLKDNFINKSLATNKKSRLQIVTPIEGSYP